MKIADKYGNTKYHIAVINNNIKKLKSLIIKDGSMIDSINDKGETFLHILCYHQSADIILKFIKWMKRNNINYNDLFSISDINKATIFDICVGKIKNKEDIKLLKKILQILYNNDQKTLVKIFNKYINNYSIAKLILKLDNELSNQINDLAQSPLIIAVAKNNYDLTKLLIEYGADINYGGLNDAFLPLNIAIKNKNNDIIGLLLDNNADITFIDNNMRTPLHNILYSILRSDTNTNKSIKQSVKQTLNQPIKLIIKMMENRNINQIINLHDISGNTPIHLIAQLNLIDDLLPQLKKLHIDLCTKNNDNKKPIDYMTADTYIRLINKIANSRIKHHTPNINITNVSFDDLEICRTNTKEQLLGHITMPKIDIDEYHESIFNADILHNVIYILYLLEKYNTLTIPYQDIIPNKIMDTVLKIKTLSHYHTIYGNVMRQLLTLFAQDFFEFMPYLIIWRDSDLNYKSNRLEHYISKTNRRFVLFKLTLIPYETMTHANVLIYDRKIHRVERFEPYGSTITFMNDTGDMDIYIKQIFKDIDKDIKYVKPSEYLNRAKFQLLSNDTNPSLRNKYDPIGYCLAWCIWFVELRLNNPDEDSKILVENAFDKIMTDMKNGNKETINPLLDYIREYTQMLIKYEKDFMDDFKNHKINHKINHKMNHKNKNIMNDIYDYISIRFNKTLE